MNISIKEWIGRGFKNTMAIETIPKLVTYPPFIGNERFHSSHRANLLKKEPEFYVKYNWVENPEDPYVWMDGEGKWYEQHSGKKGRVYI
jgi:hypothetical protein